MQGPKFSFSIKKSLGKSGHIAKNNTVFMSHEGDPGIYKGASSRTGHKAEQTPRKTTQITSFSNSLSELEQQGGSDDEDNQDEPVIECKNPLISSRAVNNIEILLNKKNASKKIVEDDFDPSSGSSGFSIPVSKFGIAMLRGMGYDPEIHNTKPKIFKKRNYNQSGLGADKEIGNIPKR